MTFLYAMQLTSRAKRAPLPPRESGGDHLCKEQAGEDQAFPVNRVLLGIEIPFGEFEVQSFGEHYRPVQTFFLRQLVTKFFMMGISNKSLQ